MSIALETAREEWARHVEEPPGKGWERIDHYIRKGLGWKWVSKYTHNRQFEWCGAFASYCYGVAGVAPKVRKRHMASCYRLYKWAHGNDRMIAPADLLPGDIAVVGPRVTDRRSRWGKHICIVERVREGVVYTIEGNAHGKLPGAQGEGVVKQQRPIYSGDGKQYRILYGVRPLAEDYD